MKHTEAGLCAQEERNKKLSKLGDPLEKLYAIDWEIFRETIEKAIGKTEQDTSKEGHPTYDSVMLFKILVLQWLYNMSDEQTEFMILDRMSFMRFLGLSLNDKHPDAKTIWLYRNRLSKGNTTKKLFKRLDEEMQKYGIVPHKGTLIDMTITKSHLKYTNGT